MATPTKTEVKKSRGEGPIVVTYADATKNDNKRVPTGVKAVVITDRKGNTKPYDLALIPTEVQHQLIALAFGGRVKTYVNNQAKDGDVNVIELSDKIFNDMATGKLYTRSESESGGARGRVFDPSIYVEAYRLTREAQHKAKVINKKSGKPVEPASEKQLKDLATQLTSIKGKDRADQIKKLLTNAVFKKHYLQLQAKNIKTGDVESIDDAF
jgi:hypothetical protein